MHKTNGEKLYSFLKLSGYPLLSIVFGAFFLVILIYFAFYPTFYVDEGLYIGAATRVLSGDFLLQNYWFDKPFMQFYWIIPGILFMGYNILGFSFSGIICSLISFYKMPKLFGAKENLITLFFFSLLFFSNPFHISYFTSSMAEPFMLLSMLLFIKYYFLFLQNQKRADLKVSYIWFALAFCVKQSALMYAPMFAGLFLLDHLSVNKIKSELLFFISSTKFIWIIAILYQISNKKKFAAITWFSKLTDQKVKYTFFEHLQFWSTQFFTTQRSIFLATFLFSLILFYFYSVARKLKKENFDIKKPFFKSLSNSKADLFIFIIPLILHFIGISLSNVKHTDRYMFLFNLQVFIVLIRFISISSKKVKQLILIVSILILGINIFSFKAEELDSSYQKGKTLLQAKYLIHEPSIVHTKLKWQFYPNNLNVFLDSCTDQKCIEERQYNLPAQAGHFMISSKKPYNLFKIFPEKTRKTLQTQILDKEIWSFLKRRLRLPKNMVLIKAVKISNLKNNNIFDLNNDTEKWEIRFSNKDISIDLDVHPVISKGKINQKLSLEGQNMIALHISSANISYLQYRFNALMLFDFILKGLTLPIQNLNAPFSSDSIYGFVSIDSPSTIKYKEIKHER